MLLGGVCAYGSTVENFTIVNSTSLSFVGGVFSGGGSYWGSFQLDTSQIPSDGTGATINLTSFDVFTSGPADVEFAPALGALASLVVGHATTYPLLGSESVDQIEFLAPAPGGGINLTLSLLEPQGDFHGGLVDNATETQFNLETEMDVFQVTDTSGSALVLDPAVLTTPEPATISSLAIGLVVWTARHRHRHTADSRSCRGPSKMV